MRVDAFVAERSSDWDELEALVRSSVGRTSKRSAQDVQRTGELYRSAAGDLAVARRRWPRHSATARLEQLVRSARSVVYGSRRSNSLLQFVRREYWRTVRERPAMLVLACVLMFGSAALGTVGLEKSRAGRSIFTESISSGCRIESLSTPQRSHC